MAKFKINTEFTPHGSFSWEHSGSDAQWCEAGDTVRLKWVNDAGWGLQEAHYTAGGRDTIINILGSVVEFTMPSSDIVIGGTFKRFVFQHWTGGKHGNFSPGYLMTTGNNNEPVPSSLTERSVKEAVEVSKNLEKVTYSTLVSRRNLSKLVAGRLYRITDYACTTAQEGTVSAGHPFDIVVLATDINALSEDAVAMPNANDLYFNGNDLKAWSLKYCLDNDTDRFAWADTVNGKGVVYWMKDEYGNECHYDFKNIQFVRHEKDLQNMVNGASYMADQGEDQFAATITQVFNSINNDTFKGQEFNKYGFDKIVDASDIAELLDFNQIQYDDGDKYCVILDNEDYGPVIVAKVLESSQNCYTFHYTDHGNATDASLTGSVKDNKFATNWDNSEYVLNNNVFFGNGCTSNTFGNGCTSNTFGNSCNSNTFGNSCSSNTFGNSCYSNTFGNSCNSNTFGNRCTYNTFGNSCYSNTFGNSCSSNTFGNDCTSNTFGNRCNYNIFGNSCNSNTFGNDCTSNTFGNRCYYNTFVNSCNSNIFGNSCNSNTFGNSCSSNTFGNSCSSNTFGNSCTSNTFGNGCTSNTFGNSCNSNTFGNDCTSNTFGNRCGNIDCSTISTANNNKLQYVNFLDGMDGSGVDFDDEGLLAGVSYSQFVGMETGGTLKIWNPAD